MNVWSYWAGPMPPWIATCIESMRRCCVKSTFRLLTPDSEQLKLCEPRCFELPPGVGTDYIRASVLTTHGGLWLDADTVLVADPAVLAERHETDRQFLYSTWSAQPRRAIAGYVYSPSLHPVAEEWYYSAKYALRSSETIGWGEIGEKMLTPIVARHGSRVWEMARETFMPIDVDCNVQRYFKASGWRDFCTEDTVGFGLNYSWMQANRSEEMSSDGELMIQRLLRDTKELEYARS